MMIFLSISIGLRDTQTAYAFTLFYTFKYCQNNHSVCMQTEENISIFLFDVF